MPRIGQQEPIEVYHFAHEGTLQAEALALMAAKLRAAVLLDGELPEDGLAAMEAGDEDMFLALARRLTESDAAQAESLEALFAQARRSEVEAEELLVDEDWYAGGTLASTVPPVETISSSHGADGVDDSPAARTPPSIGGSALPRPGGQLGLPFSDEPHSSESPAVEDRRGPAPQGGRVLTFGELARLVTRPRSRPRPAPAGQLSLFDAGLPGAA